MSNIQIIEDFVNNLNNRLDWNQYFMSSAILISSRSSCERLKVGCIIVKDNRIISSGYNGHITGTPHISIVDNNHEQTTIHAEINALAYAAKYGVSINNSIAYITHYPCINCFKALIASGVTKIIYKNDYKNYNVIQEILNNIDNFEIIKYQ